MPQVKSVKSLLETCVNFILHDRGDFCRKIGVDSVNSEKIVRSPFDYLPTVVLEELAKVFGEREINKHPKRINENESFKLLITHHLRTLDLRQWKGNSNVLQLAAFKSPHLKKLKLGYHCNRKYPGEFLNYIPKFSKLQSLDISLCGLGDDCLELLGIYCTDLRELYVQNRDVSDDGIRKLCVTGNCKSIRALVLEGSLVTIKGVELALANLPQLQVLYHASILECLSEIAQTALNGKLDMPKYSLTALYILENTIYKSQSLNLSVLLCPKVTKIHIVTWNNDRLIDADLLSLLSLENLYTIEIHHRISSPRTFVGPMEIHAGLTFNGGVAPLLQSHGGSLKKLDLKGSFIDVDILTIIESCPNLKSLTLMVDSLKNKWSNIEEKRMKQRPVMKKLVTMDLYGLVNEDILISLLSSHSLVQVRLSHCFTLSDEVLHEAARQHSFQKLRNLQLVYCASVTRKGIDILFQDTNPLKEIHLKWCHNIKKEDLIYWKEISTDKKNWDLLAIHHS